MPNDLILARARKRSAELYVALKELLEDSQHVDHDCGDDPKGCCILRARKLIESLEWAPPYKGKSHGP